MIVINMHQIFTSKNFKFTICLSDRVEENVSKHVCNDFGISGLIMHYKEPWPLLFNFWGLKLAEHAKDLLQSSPQSLRHWEKHDISPDIFFILKTLSFKRYTCSSNCLLHKNMDHHYQKTLHKTNPAHKGNCVYTALTLAQSVRGK